VLCVPGMGDLRDEYRFLTPQLVAAGYRVITMDVRGHGETSVQWPDYSVGAIGNDMVALIRHLNSGPATIIGTSMAAGAAVCAATEAPEFVTGAGHYPHAEMPEITGKLVLSFLSMIMNYTAFYLRVTLLL